MLEAVCLLEKLVMIAWGDLNAVISTPTPSLRYERYIAGVPLNNLNLIGLHEYMEHRLTSELAQHHLKDYLSCMTEIEVK